MQSSCVKEGASILLQIMNLFIISRSCKNGAVQYINNFKTNAKYVVRAYVKLLNNVKGHVWDKIFATVKIHYQAGGANFYSPTLKYLRATEGWQELTGDFIVPNKGKSSNFGCSFKPVLM